MSTPDIMAVT